MNLVRVRIVMQELSSNPIALGDEDTLRRTTLRKVAWKLIPFLCLLYVFNILDRANVGFARLSMQDNLGMSQKAFDLGYGMFYAGYLLFRSSSDSARTPRLAAIIAAVAGLDIPLIYYAPHWWNRNHPDPTKMDFSGDIKRTFFTGILVTLLLAAALVRLAYRRFRLEESLAPNH